MEAINHDLHVLAKYLFGCIHKPFIHICTYAVDCLTYAMRYTTEKCFDCGFLPVRQHSQNDRLCLHTSCDDGHKIGSLVFSGVQNYCIINYLPNMPTFQHPEKRVQLCARLL